MVSRCCGEHGINPNARSSLRRRSAHYRVPLVGFGMRRWPTAPDRSVCSAENRMDSTDSQFSKLLRHCIADNVPCALFWIRTALQIAERKFKPDFFYSGSALCPHRCRKADIKSIFVCAYLRDAIVTTIEPNPKHLSQPPCTWSFQDLTYRDGRRAQNSSVLIR